MDDGVLSLAVYCRNAHQCLQSAAESRKAKLHDEELEHLKAFASLVTSSIPTHPQFRGWKDIQETQPLDLHVRIPEIKQRIRELEDSTHPDRPCSTTTTNGQKNVPRPLSKSAEPSPLLTSVRSGTKSMASPQSKPNPSSKFSSEVMLKTSKSVRIVEAAPKQRPQRWDVTMAETYGLAKTTTTAARPNSLIQRLKKGSPAQPADSKASPARVQIGKEVARPSSAQGFQNPTSAFRPTLRSRDASRMRGGAGPSTTLSGMGSTALKVLTSSVVKGRADEDCTSSGKPKLATSHQTASGRWVWKNPRSGSSDISADAAAAESKGLKTDSDEVEELIEWIPSRENDRVPKQRSVNESGFGVEESSGPEMNKHRGEVREERWFRSPARGLGLREWKGGFLRGENQRLDESHDSLDESHVTGSDRSRGIMGTDNRPASAPVRRAAAPNTRVVKGTFTASPSPGVQRGVRENCERFRRQMRLLKEKADDTRMREEEVENMAERLQQRFVDDTDLEGGDIWGNNNNQIRVDGDEAEVHRLGRFSSSFQTIEHNAGCFQERTSLESLNRTMTRLVNHGEYPNSQPETVAASCPLSEKRKPMAESVSMSSSSTSSQSSLPLSHYIQKLRDSRLKKSAGGRHQIEDMKHNKLVGEDGDVVLTVTGVDVSSERRDKLGSSSTMLLTTNSSSGSPNAGLHRPPPPPCFGNRSHVYPSLAHRPPQMLHNRKPESMNLSSIAMLQTSPDDSGSTMVATQAGGKAHQHQQAICYPPNESRASVLSRSIHESVHHDANDEKIAHLQRVLGELKGSMEGVKIRIEVESEGWRGRVDRLEKDLEKVKETDDELSAAKHSFKNELKLKFSEFMSDTEKLLREERQQMQVMVEERIEEQVKGQLLASCWADMKEEMCLLWSEVNSLMKSREDIAGHVEHLSFVTEKVQEHSSREQDMLKSENGFLRKQLQSLQSDGGQVSSETDKEDLRQVVEKLKNDGIDMKMEIQGLRNIEKVLKVELGDLRTRLGKVQDETEGLEREREMTLVEGARERLLIMERVENLSQLYLGGLEEMRQDFSQVKLGCSERVEDVETQWNDFRRNQGILCDEGTAFLTRQVLLNELDQFRSEIADMVESERGVLKETLEEESKSIWRKVMDAYANNKSDMLSMLKLEIQKQLHSAREKVLNMTDALEHDMDALKTELRHTQDGAEDLTQIIISAKRQKEVAAQAAAEATSSATKTRETLTDMLVSIESEVANVRLDSMQLQEKLTIEKDIAVAAASETLMVSQEVLKEKEAALAAFQEVRQKSQELQDYLEKESPELVTAMLVVQKERDTASQAAAEATTAAMKAGGVLAEVLGSFNLEIAKARHINMQLQEGLEHERGLVTHLSREVQDRFSEELEVAIATWKHAMDEEIAKVKKSSEGLDKENQSQKTGLPLLDLEDYISKAEDKLSSLMAIVEQLQESTSNHDEEKKRLKQDWKANMTQLNQVVQTVEERVDELSSEQSELRKRLKRFEGVQTELMHSVGEVRSNTSTLEKTVNSFLPQYDDAVRIVNDLSCKVDRMKKRIEGFAYDDDLAQVISRVAEAKVVESLKESTISPVGLQDLGRDLRDLQDRVEHNDHSHCQAIAAVETRVAVVESTLCNIQNGGHSEKAEIGALNGSVDTLQRKMDILEQSSALSADYTGLENRIDHVSSATFTNLQLLDNKMERVSMGVQSALEGAALADSKCGALGAELVKVFRMLTLTKVPSNNAHGIGGNNNWPQLPDNRHNRGIRRGRSHSPSSRSATQRLESRSQSPPPRLAENKSCNNSGIRGPSSPSRRSGGTHMPPRGLTKSGARESKRTGGRGGEAGNLKVESTRERDRATKEASFLEEMEGDHPSPFKNDNWLKSYPREISRPFKLGKPGLPEQALTVVEDNNNKQQQAGPYLALERRPKNLQKTNIRLEAGRIHVNVSRRSATASASQSEKRSDAIAVQS